MMFSWYVYNEQGRRVNQGRSDAPRFLSAFRRAEESIGRTLRTCKRPPRAGVIALTFSDDHTLVVVL
jgi:hypothetical protein